ncbi:DUF1475 family protein [Liberiplasma polymorphum]|jgi:hypothetical protein|uniref:DUF1475 family protein n=1 Tax=Liberiplasma polymorphum TaxID=3374570 RepID=UPI00377273F9
MKVAKIISLLGFLSMFGVLIYGFTVGDFSEDGGLILSNPWGIVSLVDLYVGFALFSLWIVFREKNIVYSIIWVILMMIFGFFTGAIYTLYALHTSKGSWLTLFLGSRKDAILKQEFPKHTE